MQPKKSHSTTLSKEKEALVAAFLEIIFSPFGQLFIFSTPYEYMIKA